MLLTQLLSGLSESVDPAGREQMYIGGAGTLGLSGMHYFHSGCDHFLVKRQFGF